ncbi:MAG: outer membrane protein assembly factor BamD [Spirochaetaceae bacterium]|jgi:outer membrane protein assembly factor BamD (BamD/ComL family)|nr:outer membrane protein assembly factor BamD [Spirochaetaceae bacterium]
MNKIWFLSWVVFAFLTGCFTGPVVIPDNASAQEIIQMGQTAMDRDRYNQAIQYFQAVLERFPYNDAWMCDAEYGVAAVHYKQKKYTLAKEELSALLAKYDASGGSNLPKRYQILARNRLNVIAEKQRILAQE